MPASPPPAAAGPPQPPPPEEPLVYPIVFSKLAEEESAPAASAASSSASLQQVTIFSALHWLVPVYELAEWMPKATPQRNHRKGNNNGNDAAAAAEGEEQQSDAEAAALAAIPYEDVRSALTLLPQFEKFFVEASKIIPQHTELCYTIESFTLPTPKGPKVITRSKVEGDYRATHAAAHAPSTPGAAGATTMTTVTNSTAYFSLLAGHNQFLLYYEEKEKLRYFNYLQLDQLRFAWVAVKELIEDTKVFNMNDGSLTGLAKRDVKKNNTASPFCLSPAAAASNGVSSNGAGGNSRSNTSSNGAGGSSGSGPAVGRGGGNAQMHQGTSGNVITAPNKEVLEEKKRMQQLRFLREELEKECERRWPYTPVAKSCLFTVEEKIETELPEEALQQLGLVGAHNARNRKNANRRGPRYFLGVVELPLLNKKGGAARFKATRWHSNRRDAESAAAEATLLALRNMKS